MPNTSRIVSGKNQDQTGSVITYDYQAPVYAATIAPAIVMSRTTVGPIALTGACTFNPSISQSYIGDELNILFTNGTGGTLVVTGGANTSNTGTLSVAAGKKGSITFIFDGATWVETGRSVTA